jgi:hypothetical protein
MTWSKKVMLEQSISQILNQQFSQLKTVAVEKKTAPPLKIGSTEKAFTTPNDETKTPASKATSAAAAAASGIKRTQLEVAAAAGLLRPISAENPAAPKQSDQSLKGLLHTISELEKPDQSHNLDVFE